MVEKIVVIMLYIGSNITINGGKIYGDDYGIFLNHGTLKINSGEIYTYGADSIAIFNDNGNVIIGDLNKDVSITDPVISNENPRNTYFNPVIELTGVDPSIAFYNGVIKGYYSMLHNTSNYEITIRDEYMIEKVKEGTQYKEYLVKKQ